MWRYKEENNFSFKIEPLNTSLPILINTNIYDKKTTDLKDTLVCSYNLKGELLNTYLTVKEASIGENELKGNIDSCITENKASELFSKYAQRKGKIYFRLHKDLVNAKIKTGHKILEKINVLNNQVEQEYLMMTVCAKDLGIKKEVLDGWIKRQVTRNGYSYKYKQY
jgi:hypothetical protein